MEQQDTFQYLTEIFTEREIQERLGELGSVGWELVTAHWEEYTFGGRTHFQARCILKRRVTVADTEFATPVRAYSAF